MTTWTGAPEPEERPPGLAGWLRILLRGAVLGTVVFGGLAVLLLVRLIERPLCGVDRPVTPYITQGVCRAAFVILQLPIHVHGPRLGGPGAVVANHTSWLDIFALNSRKNVYFVSKSEVAGWPGIGWLARATGTVFIKRDPKEARSQTQIFEERLLHGHRLLFFPEGTSTDGQQVLPFKTTLFAAFFADALRHEMQVQAVSVIYHAPEGEDPRFYGWWGDMSFGTHLLRTLAARQQGRVELFYHPPVRVDAFANRKSLARHLEDQVRRGHAVQGEMQTD
ncbi:lysophospholipid acyltransferase family protein [Thalassococcus sp. BH17M4-6]|uniref:lysophospholipid acyltransferase family protein n=1 Tax=Thalassococcus sp. BH17M4-6 TaxID=3413148 RepID=UPI003BCA9985